MIVMRWYNQVRCHRSRTFNGRRQWLSACSGRASGFGERGEGALTLGEQVRGEIAMDADSVLKVCLFSDLAGDDHGDYRGYVEP